MLRKPVTAVSGEEGEGKRVVPERALSCACKSVSTLKTLQTPELKGEWGGQADDPRQI
jgi:hypothetical protein